MIALASSGVRVSLLALALLAAVGVGLVVAHLFSASKPRWTVRVFLCAASDESGRCGGRVATPAQVEALRAVARGLLADRKVESARFVSGDGALQRFRKGNPDLAQALTSNPFPPSEDLVVRGRRAAERIAARFHEGRGGVSHVIYSGRLEAAR